MKRDTSVAPEMVQAPKSDSGFGDAGINLTIHTCVRTNAAAEIGEMVHHLEFLVLKD
jgi:hypothetical protein